jgi:hypothetical protein
MEATPHRRCADGRLILGSSPRTCAGYDGKVLGLFHIRLTAAPARDRVVGSC